MAHRLTTSFRLENGLLTPVDVELTCADMVQIEGYECGCIDCYLDRLELPDSLLDVGNQLEVPELEDFYNHFNK